MGGGVSNEKLYDVYWEGPWKISDAKPASGHVLYQLVGTHCLYGPNQLLYIGQTQRENFGARLAEHIRVWAAKESDEVQVCLGSVGEFSDWATWNASTSERYDTVPRPDAITAIESLLIYAHQPAYNSREKVRIRPLSTEHLRVFNTGVFRRLLPEVSTRRYVDISRSPEPEGML